jgi:hypothetical protein
LLGVPAGALLNSKIKHFGLLGSEVQESIRVFVSVTEVKEILSLPEQVLLVFSIQEMVFRPLISRKASSTTDLVFCCISMDKFWEARLLLELMKTPVTVVRNSPVRPKATSSSVIVNPLGVFMP